MHFFEFWLFLKKCFVFNKKTVESSIFLYFEILAQINLIRDFDNNYLYEYNPRYGIQYIILYNSIRSISIFEK